MGRCVVCYVGYRRDSEEIRHVRLRPLFALANALYVPNPDQEGGGVKSRKVGHSLHTAYMNAEHRLYKIGVKTPKNRTPPLSRLQCLIQAVFLQYVLVSGVEMGLELRWREAR